MVVRFFAVVLSVVLWIAAPVAAQVYPNKVITMIVPFTAGGPTDTVGRLLGVPMSKTIGQQVIVENVGGAGGTIAANRVSKGTPDGYTILIHHPTTETWRPILKRVSPFRRRSI